jgi:hypothetical protein
VFNFDIQRAIEREIWRALYEHRVAVAAAAVVLVLLVVAVVRLVRVVRRT